VLPAKSSVFISKPLETVFAFVADFENEPKWKPEVVKEVQQISGRPGQVGAKYREVIRSGEEWVESTFEIITVERDHIIAFKSASSTKGIYTFEGAEGGLLLSFAVELSSRGALQKLALPFKNYRLRGKIAEELANLKKLLEAPSSPEVL
jgi:uncharacterized membrane protein